MLMRRTSPSTRIIGGRPADRCRSDALFLTENASNSAISMRAPRHYVHTMTLDATTEAPVETMTPAPQYRHKFRGATPIPTGSHVSAQALQIVLQTIENAARRAGRPT